MAGLMEGRARSLDSDDTIAERLRGSIAITEKILAGELPDQVAEVAERIVSAFRLGKKVIFMGNGGSAADAGHLAAELMGRYAYDRPALPAISLGDSTAAMTAIANDYGYDEVFSRQVLGFGGPGDVVIGLSTSGMSKNVVRALRTAREAGMVTVALTGDSGGRVADAAEYVLRIPSDDTAYVQEASMHLGHTICGLVEREMFPAPA